MGTAAKATVAIVGLIVLLVALTVLVQQLKPCHCGEGTDNAEGEGPTAEPATPPRAAKAATA
jgi:hypothetical protein